MAGSIRLLMFGQTPELKATKPVVENHRSFRAKIMIRPRPTTNGGIEILINEIKVKTRSKMLPDFLAEIVAIGNARIRAKIMAMSPNSAVTGARLEMMLATD